MLVEARRLYALINAANGGMHSLIKVSSEQYRAPWEQRRNTSGSPDRPMQDCLPTCDPCTPRIHCRAFFF